MEICENCGKLIDLADMICPECGHHYQEEKNNS